MVATRLSPRKDYFKLYVTKKDFSAEKGATTLILPRTAQEVRSWVKNREREGAAGTSQV